MSKVNKKVICVLVLGILLFASFPTMVRGERKVTLSQTCVLFEMLGMRGCMGCGQVQADMEIFNTTYGPSKLAELELWFGGFYDKANDDTIINNRVRYYDSSSVVELPQVYIDGSIKEGPGAVDITVYENDINTRLSTPRSYDLSVSGNIASGSVTVHLDKTGSSSATNLFMRYYLVENNAYGRNFVARTMPSENSVTSVPSGGIDFIKTFSFNPIWNPANLTFIAFLQSDTDKEVLQTICYTTSVVPEINPLVIFPIGGLFAVILAISMKRKKKN